MSRFNKIFYFINIAVFAAIAIIIVASIVNAWNSPNNNPPYSTNQVMYVNSSGNVGIGTANPGAKLEVNGQIKITGGSPGTGKTLISDSSGLASWGWQGFRGAIVMGYNPQSIPTNTVSILSFDAENYDTNNIHDNSVNNSRLIVPSGVTKVKLSARVYWEAPSVGAGLRYICIRYLGGSCYGSVGGPGSSDSTVTQQEAFTPVLNVAGGDYFEVLVVHGFGSNINVFKAPNLSNTWFSMEIIE